MAKVTIRFAESAIADLAAIRSWYSDQGAPDIGDRFVEDIITRIQALGEHPDMGRIVPEFDQPLLRELVHRPFRIVYRRDPKHVRIVRIWRGERPLSQLEDEGA